MSWNLNRLPPQPSSRWLAFTRPDDLRSKRHRGPHRTPQSYNKRLSVHLSALLQSHQIYCGSHFLSDQKAKSYKLIRPSAASATRAIHPRQTYKFIRFLGSLGEKQSGLKLSAT